MINLIINPDYSGSRSSLGIVNRFIMASLQKKGNCIVYKVIFAPSAEGGYTVSCPTLPGCISEGDTKEEAIENITEAIKLYLRAVEKERNQEYRNFHF